MARYCIPVPLTSNLAYKALTLKSHDTIGNSELEIFVCKQVTSQISTGSIACRQGLVWTIEQWKWAVSVRLDEPANKRQWREDLCALHLRDLYVLALLLHHRRATWPPIHCTLRNGGGRDGGGATEQVGKDSRWTVLVAGAISARLGKGGVAAVVGDGVTGSSGRGGRRESQFGLGMGRAVKETNNVASSVCACRLDLRSVIPFSFSMVVPACWSPFCFNGIS